MDTALVLEAQTFLLAFCRVGGILGSGPFFSGRGVPGPFKIGICLFITLLVLPILPHGGVTIPASLLGTCLAVLREVALGVATGLVAQLLFSAVQLAGELMGLQMGLSIMNMVDPSSGASVPVIAEFYTLFATLLFFVIDAHHIFLRGVFTSFEIAPLGGAHFNPQLAASLTDVTGQVFLMAVELVGPVMAALFLADLALGLVARTMPQMNVFTIGFPLKILVGLLTLAATLPLMASLLSGQFNGLNLAIHQILRGM